MSTMKFKSNVILITGIVAILLLHGVKGQSSSSTGISFNTTNSTSSSTGMFNSTNSTSSSSGGIVLSSSGMNGGDDDNSWWDDWKARLGHYLDKDIIQKIIDWDMKKDRDVNLQIDTGTSGETRTVISSQTRDPPLRNRFEVEYFGGGDRFRMQVRTWLTTDVSKISSNFDLGFQKIVEYRESDGVAGYSESDTKVHEYHIGAKESHAVRFAHDDGSNVNIGTNSTTGNGGLNSTIGNGNLNSTTGSYQSFRCFTPDNVFILYGYIATTTVNIGDVTMLPTSHKFTIVITPNWEMAADTKLALVTDITAKSNCKLDRGHAADDDKTTNVTTQITVDDNSNPLPFAKFTWKPKCTARMSGDGTSQSSQDFTVFADSLSQDADVIPSAFYTGDDNTDLGSDETRQCLAFTFDLAQVSSFEWDPFVSLDVGSYYNSASRATISGVMMSVLIALLVTMFS